MALLCSNAKRKLRVKGFYYVYEIVVQFHKAHISDSMAGTSPIRLELLTFGSDCGAHTYLTQNYIRWLSRSSMAQTDGHTILLACLSKQQNVAVINDFSKNWPFVPFYHKL